MSSVHGVLQEHKNLYFDSSRVEPPDYCPLAPEGVDQEYSVGVAATISAVEALRPVWNKWVNTLETDVDYFLHNIGNDPTILCPYAVVVYSQGIPQAMLLGQVRRHRVSEVVSFVSIKGPNAKVLEISKAGRIGRPSAVIDKALVLHLLRAVKNRRVDLLRFDRLPLGSELFRQMQNLPGLLFKERVPRVLYYSRLSLTASGKRHSELCSGKTRREVRRKRRNLDRTFPGQVRLRCFSQVNELDMGMCDAMRVAVTTWQYYLGSGLSDTAQTRRTLRFFAQQGWLRIYVLYVNKIPCAYLVGQLYNNTFHCQYAGYQPNFANFSVGSVLTAQAFEELAAEGAQQVDLGEGGQEHNRRLGCQRLDEGIVHLYSPTLRGVWLGMLFGTAGTIRRGGRHTRSTLRLNRLSKIWQQYLLSKWHSHQASSRSEQATI